MELEPPGFLEQAAKDENWPDSHWLAWCNRGRPLFEDAYEVRTLRLITGERRSFLEAESPYADRGERIDQTAELPTFEALSSLGQRLGKQRHKIQGIDLPERWEPSGYS